MVQEEETKLRGSRPRHETPLNSDSRCAWEMEGERHGHPWTHEKIAFDMAMMGIKPPDGAASQSVLVVHHNGAGNGEIFRIVRGEAGLHAATLVESPLEATFHIGWEEVY